MTCPIYWEGLYTRRTIFPYTRWTGRSTRYAPRNVVLSPTPTNGKMQLYTQNLSLFAKLFLDTKSVFYDVTTFLYYLLLYRDPAIPNCKPQVVGFFSKEKLSWDNNNLACILVFPPWQKKGFGQVLMGVSYELGRREGRLGGPEKRKYFLPFRMEENQPS
jgi:GNAT superfamily N-acetyltransferase